MKVFWAPSWKFHRRALVVPMASVSPVTSQPRWPCFLSLCTVFFLLSMVPLICLQLGEPSPLCSLMLPSPHWFGRVSRKPHNESISRVKHEYHPILVWKWLEALLLREQRCSLESILDCVIRAWVPISGYKTLFRVTLHLPQKAWLGTFSDSAFERWPFKFPVFSMIWNSRMTTLSISRLLGRWYMSSGWNSE